MDEGRESLIDLSGPIIRSRLEPDFYKFTMGQLIWRKYQNVPVIFSFQNRTPRARLGEVIDIGELREQFDHARALMFTSGELDYLRGMSQQQERMFDEAYVEFLRDVRLPEYQMTCQGSELKIDFTGRWSEVTYWETIALSIVNETYYRTLLRRLSRVERAAVVAEGIRRLQEKIAALRARPDIFVSDFGTRRRFSARWQHYVVRTLMEELNHRSSSAQFLGTSNTYAAMTTGVLPMGTSAHELPMIIAGLLDSGDADPAWLRTAQRQVLDDWWQEYGWGLSIFLPDTFGTDFFFTVLTADDLKRWKGFRWDSGNLFEFAGRIINAYQNADINSRDKMLVASDALELPLILESHDRLIDRIRLSYGWGTGLTNDVLDNVMIGDSWFGPLSLVVKPTQADGRGLVKLSDNPAKAVGAPNDIIRYKRAAEYAERQPTALKY